ncbi:hypothetical protein M513_13504 [Trichuris suis]|uniref:Uncharacterized protein n=1 Tax=Trichuris suis TaxID=68888 RepID=A0A085LKW6_9BILA|nr:hypothetical protein M513_13504 [Trichuris suis]
MRKRCKCNARAKKNECHAKPNNIGGAVAQKVVQHIKRFPLYMLDKCENTSTKLDAVTKPSGDKMQRVICEMLQYVKCCLDYLVSRLSHKNVDETDATLSSQLSETGEPEGAPSVNYNRLNKTYVSRWGV